MGVYKSRPKLDKISSMVEKKNISRLDIRGFDLNGFGFGFLVPFG